MSVLVSVCVTNGDPIGAVVPINNISVLVGDLFAAERVALKHHTGVGNRPKALQLDGALQSCTTVVLHDLHLSVGRADGRVGAVLVYLRAVVEQFAALVVVPVRQYKVVHHSPGHGVCILEIRARSACGVEVWRGLRGFTGKA